MQNFQKFFRKSGWFVELLAIPTTHSHGPRRFLEYHRKLASAVRAKHADVVLACDLYSLSAAAWMRRHGQATLAIYDAREVYTELPSVAQKPFVKMMWKRLERHGLAVADVIVVTAPHDLQAILDVHGFVPRSVLVRNMPWRDTTLVRNRSLLERYSIPTDAKVFVYIGGLQQGRGLSQFILSMKGEEFHFLVIGDGDLRASLQLLVESSGVADRVHFAGAIGSDEAMIIAAACDVGVVLVEPLSKSYELALPSKVFEYMMAGLPILASEMRHVRELFSNEEWIVFADVANEDSIRNDIQSVLALTGRSDLREAERTLALDRYHFEADAAQLLALVESKLSLL